jgi:periplasmic divalent cation tolerance protein
VNIIDPVTSIYWREGAVQEDSETVLVVKTRDELVVQLTDRVKTLHSYSCPCVVALPVEGGNRDYLEWIARETAAASADQDG